MLASSVRYQPANRRIGYQSGASIAASFTVLNILLFNLTNVLNMAKLKNKSIFVPFVIK